MNTMKRLFWVSFASICFGIPTISFAAKCAGNNINNMIVWDSNELSKGVTLTTFRHSSVMVSENPAAPFHLAAGECGGTLIAMPDGKMQGWGHCARKDKEGDVLNEAWVLPLGTELKGSWKNVGGTGKYTDAADTGSFEVVMSQGKMAAVHWVGNCQ
jgi:hypothetical protein